MQRSEPRLRPMLRSVAVAQEKENTMRTMVRSIALSAVTLLLVGGMAVAQCGPKAGCGPKETQAKGEGKEKTLTGVVSDSSCGRKHTMMPGKSDAECTRACVMKGSKYALVVGDKVYTLEGQSAELDKLAGEKAKVTGTVSGDTIQVASVAPAKAKKS